MKKSKKVKRIHPSKLDKRSKEYKAWYQRKLARDERNAQESVSDPTTYVRTRSMRKQELVNAADLIFYKDAFKLSNREIGHRLGISDSSIAAYIRKNEMPKITQQAIQHQLYLATMTDKPKTSIMVMAEVKHEQIVAVKALFDSMNVNCVTMETTNAA